MARTCWGKLPRPSCSSGHPVLGPSHAPPRAEALVQFILLNLYTVLESALIPLTLFSTGEKESSRNVARGNNQKAEEPKCPQMGEEMKKMCCVHTTEYCSVLEKEGHSDAHHTTDEM